MERMGRKEKKKSGKRTVEVHKMEGLYPYVRLEDFMKVCKELEEENKKLNIKVASLEGEIKGLNYTIERLHKEIEELEKQPPRFSDFGGYYLDK